MYDIFKNPCGHYWKWLPIPSLIKGCSDLQDIDVNWKKRDNIPGKSNHRVINNLGEMIYSWTAKFKEPNTDTSWKTIVWLVVANWQFKDILCKFVSYFLDDDLNLGHHQLKLRGSFKEKGRMSPSHHRIYHGFVPPHQGIYPWMAQLFLYIEYGTSES